MAGLWSSEIFPLVQIGCYLTYHHSIGSAASRGFSGQGIPPLASWRPYCKPFHPYNILQLTFQWISDYWRYFEPIRQNMPKNCSADVQAVIAHIDEVFTSNDTTAINKIKDTFGLGGLSHLDDVAGAREFFSAPPTRNSVQPDVNRSQFETTYGIGRVCNQHQDPIPRSPGFVTHLRSRTAK